MGRLSLANNLDNALRNDPQAVVFGIPGMTADHTVVVGVLVRDSRQLQRIDIVSGNVDVDQIPRGSVDPKGRSRRRQDCIHLHLDWTVGRVEGQVAIYVNVEEMCARIIRCVVDRNVSRNVDDGALAWNTVTTPCRGIIPVAIFDRSMRRILLDLGGDCRRFRRLRALTVRMTGIVRHHFHKASSLFDGWRSRRKR